jgi:hypothetical protein
MKTRLLHIAALTSFAIAQPLYDVLSHSGEFFVAYRVDRLDILLLVFWISVVPPAIAFGLVWLADRLDRRAGAVMMAALVGLFAAVVALPPAAHRVGAGPGEVLVVCAAHGVLATLLYARFSAARQFLTLLSPAALVFPVWFLATPTMRPFIHPPGAMTRAAAEVPGDTPIVFVIFDQLPLTSLLDANGGIDAHAFPGFAAVASDAIWYRNATTVADYTGWAIPAFLTGTYPRTGRLPIAASYPRNLFTALASRYRIHAAEPLTHLCPDAVCPENREPRVDRQRSMLSDLSVVYARIVLPDALATGLPRLTKNWRNFVRARQWKERWVVARNEDRVAPMQDFIKGIDASNAQPSLYFAHVLLPHEPYEYLPDLRQFATESGMIGLGEGGIWSADPWYATQTYRRHLMQLGCVDTLVSQLLDRLKRQGLYDRALIVITSDHGVSFRPGTAMKGFGPATVADVVPVPLFIKPPHHQGAEVSDRNVQAIDVLPTIADLLHTRLPFDVQGVSAVGQAPAGGKRVYYGDATRIAELPDSLWGDVMAAVARKHDIFDSSSHDNFWLPRDVPFKELLGRAVRDLPMGGPSDMGVELDSAWKYTELDLTAPHVPARVSGSIRGSGPQHPGFLAVAVNGVVAAVTKSAGTPLPNAGSWAALVPPQAFRNGVNPIDVFEIATENGGTILRQALHSGEMPASLNFIRGEAYYDWNVRNTGLYPREPLGADVFRWTNGDATFGFEKRLTRDTTLEIALAPMTRPQTPLTIQVNDCTLFDGILSGGEWSQTFTLDRCPDSTFQGSTVGIRIKSDAVPAPKPDTRRLGVPLLAVRVRRP